MRNHAGRTARTYTDTVRLLATHCQAHARPLPAGELRREHIQTSSPTSWLAGSWPPPTTATGACTPSPSGPWPWATWQASPVDGMRPPQLPEQPVDVVRAEQLARLLRSCEGRDFASRRDTASILLLVDTGMRRWVLGKGRRPRTLPIGRKTAQALDRYLRARATGWLMCRPCGWPQRPMTSGDLPGGP
jgi:integrase/recombinase XerC